MKQGGLTMERTNPTSAPDPRHTWATGLRAAMKRHYGEGFRNNQLARDTDKAITEQTVSRWLNAEVSAPSIQLVRLTATTLRWNLAEALVAAGYGELVAEIDASLARVTVERAKTEAELQHELAALQDEVNTRLSELRQRLDRRGAQEGNTGNGSAVS